MGDCIACVDAGHWTLGYFCSASSLLNLGRVASGAMGTFFWICAKMLAEWAWTTATCSRLLCYGEASFRAARRASWWIIVMHNAHSNYTALSTMNMHWWTTHLCKIRGMTHRSVSYEDTDGWDIAVLKTAFKRNVWSPLRKEGMYPCIFYAGEPLLCSEGPWWRSDCMSLLDARALFCSSAKQVIHEQQQQHE